MGHKRKIETVPLVFQILDLASKPGGATMAEIVEATGTTKATAYTIVRQMNEIEIVKYGTRKGYQNRSIRVVYSR